MSLFTLYHDKACTKPVTETLVRHTDDAEYNGEIYLKLTGANLVRPYRARYVTITTNKGFKLDVNIIKRGDVLPLQLGIWDAVADNVYTEISINHCIVYGRDSEDTIIEVEKKAQNVCT